MTGRGKVSGAQKYLHNHLCKYTTCLSGKGKKQFKKIHVTQKLADVSMGLAVLDEDTRWTSRAEGGQGVPCPRVLRVVALVSVSVTK